MTDRLARIAEMRKLLPHGQMGLAGLAQAVEPTVALIAVFFVPWRILRGPVGLITFSDVLLIASFALLLAGQRISLRPLGRHTWIWLCGFALVVFGLLVSSLLFGDALQGLNIIAQYFFTFAILPFVIFGREREETLRLIKALVFSLVLIEGFGILCYFIQWNPTGRIYSGSRRLMSLMEEANSNAAIVAMAVPLALYLWQMKQLSHLVVLGVVMPVFITALVLTSSVSGLAAACFGTLIFVFATFNPMMFGRAIIVFASLSLVFAIGGAEMIPKTFEKRVLAPLETGDIEAAGTFQGRLTLMREALETIEQNPVLGLGADEFRGTSSSRQPVHNIYLLLWVEGGILSLLGWLAILLAAGLLSLEAYLAPATRLTGAVALSLTVAFVFVGLNTPHMYGRFWVMPFFLAIALAVDATAKFAPSVRLRRRRV